MCIRDSRYLIRSGIGVIVRHMAREVKGHDYDASLRRERSGVRRQRIVDAARDLMIEHGYRATKVSAVAARAGVNVDTVYELVGRKPILLPVSYTHLTLPTILRV